MSGLAGGVYESRLASARRPHNKRRNLAGEPKPTFPSNDLLNRSATTESPDMRRDGDFSTVTYPRSNVKPSQKRETQWPTVNDCNHKNRRS